MAKQTHQKHPVADQFSDEEMEGIKRYGQALGGVTPFDEAVEARLAEHEANAPKMRAAQTGGSPGLGPTEAEQTLAKQQ
jgi:Lon protease-like protein